MRDQMTSQNSANEVTADEGRPTHDGRSDAQPPVSVLIEAVQDAGHEPDLVGGFALRTSVRACSWGAVIWRPTSAQKAPGIICCLRAPGSWRRWSIPMYSIVESKER